MAPFFDVPGSNAGPYSTPPQQGIFSRILQGVDVALKLGDFYQNWQGKNQARENQELQGLASQVGLGQKIAEMTGQPVPVNEGMAKKLGNAGYTWPTTTPEVQAGAQGKAINAGMSTGEVPTTGFERVGEEKGRGIANQVAEKMPVGGPMPITPKETRVGILGRGGTFRTETAPPGTSHFMTEPAPAAQNWMFDREGNPIANLGGGKAFFVPKEDETPEQKRQRQLDVQDARNKGRGGKGGAEGGRPDVLTNAKLFEKAYQEEKALPGNEGLTRVQFRPKWNTKPDTTTTTDKSNRKKTVTTRTTVQPQPKTSLDTAFDEAAPSVYGNPIIPPAATQTVPPSKYGGKYYSEGGQHFQWDGAKYIPYTGQ